MKQYGSFYYENVLPDDESTESQREIGRRLKPWYDFHRDVQDVVNLTYTAPEDQRAAYEAAGRLNHGRALARLKEVTAKHNLADLLLGAAGA